MHFILKKKNYEIVARLLYESWTMHSTLEKKNKKNKKIITGKKKTIIKHKPH